MATLLPPFPEEEAEDLIVSADEDTETLSVQPPDELVPATELPSAAAALAELFSGKEDSAEVAAVEESPAEASLADEPQPEEAAAEERAPENPAVEIRAEIRQDAGAKSPALDGRAETGRDWSAAEPATELESAPAQSVPGQNAADAPETAPAERPPMASSDWAFEERLANHREWVDSQGLSGKKVDFSGAKLGGAELISVNLRFADLHDADLKAADLLLADLRDTCLMRADLQESCLVGANLEGANLEGASLDTAMGLVPRQLAGANLRDASLPGTILEFEVLPEFERASRGALRFFWVTMAASLLSWLAAWKTKDVQLLTDSAIVPFLRSPAASAALPTAEFYLIAPVVLFITYLVFLFHLQRLWDAVLELPAVFPDGRALGDREPAIIAGLLRAHFRWMNQDASSTRIVEKASSLFVAYWIVPATLLMFWARYLTLQELHGTALHELLIMGATGLALYATTRVGRPQEKWGFQEKRARRVLGRFKSTNPFSLAIALGVVLTFLSVGTIAGIPHDPGRAPQYGAANIRRWAPSVFWAAGFDPYADLTEASISTRPANWNGADDQVAWVKGARLNNKSLRYVQAYGVFLANAHLWRADFQGAFLSAADLRGADLGQSNLRLATMDGIRMNHANLDRASLDRATLARADLREANLSYSSLGNAILVDARLDGATLYGARLESATLIRANLERADLRESDLENADLEHADLQQAYLWSAKLPGAHMGSAQLGNAILIGANLRGADLGGAQFAGTVLNGADLSGTNLGGADLRGALGLSAVQVCSARSRQGAILDDALQVQVDAQCGGAH